MTEANSGGVRRRESDLGEVEARTLVERIGTGLASVWADVQAAYFGRAWVALGYGSWDELCRVEFDSARLRLPREDRQEVVASLRDTGMSTRAIVAATGTNDKTVRNDLAARAEKSACADANTSECVTGIDGKTYHQPVPTLDAVVEAELVQEGSPVVSAAVAGRRRPLTEAADDAGWELKRAAEKVARVLDDDRYGKNQQQVALALRGHLLAVSDAVTAALNQLDQFTDPGDTDQQSDN